jgi:hypothetical protein
VRSSGRGFIQPSLAGFLFRTRRPLGVYRNVFYRFNIFFDASSGVCDQRV